MPLVSVVLLSVLFWGTLALTGCSQRHYAANETLPRRVAVSEDAARRLSDRVSKALQGRGPLYVSVTEEELTSYLALNLQGLPLRCLAVWFTQGQMRFSAQLDAWGQPEIRGHLGLACSKGKIQVCLIQATLNGQPLPRFLLASVEEAANDALADAQVPLRVERISLNEGSVLVTVTVD